MSRRPIQSTVCRAMRRGVGRVGMTRAAGAALAAFVGMPVAGTQDACAQGGRSLIVAPTYQSWQFGTSVPLDSIRVKSATQIAAPFLVDLPLGSRWTASISGAAFSSQLVTDSASSGVARSMSGVTDLRVRATGRVIGDALHVTFGVNIPTGATGLSAIQNDVVRVVAAPALGAAVAVPGVGLGGTVGAVFAHRVGDWAVALGGAFEQRGTYSPLEVAIAGKSARTELVPGKTVHVSLGADGLVGANRLSIGLVGDLYGTDQLRSISDGKTQADDYQLGPTGSATMSLQIANPRIRDFTLQFSDRFRSTFKDAAGVAVVGSSGNYIEASGSGLIGTAGRPSLVIGVDVRQHSGLPVDKSFIGAELTAIGATLGLSLPIGDMEWRPTAHVSQGTLKTQRVSTTMLSLTAGLTISAR